MTRPILGVNFQVPASPVYFPTAPEADVLIPEDQSPSLYTDSGPFPLGQGLRFTQNAIVVDPNTITEGTLDSGTFGS
jgi:hypothetical protein